LRARLQAVRDFRLSSANRDTRDRAATPYAFFHNGQPIGPYVAIPAQTSEQRPFWPVAHLSDGEVASNTLYTMLDPDGFGFALLSSTAFITWLKAYGGRIKADPRFSGKMSWNTFPAPQSTPSAVRARVVQAGYEVLAARPPDVPLGQVYTALAMPPSLVKAHKRLDKAVDELLDLSPSSSFDVRAASLLERYAELKKAGVVEGVS
jgi:hypothetical protein